MHAVSIIVPTLNEAENIDLLLERIFAVEKLQQYDFEVIFSDGGSTDATCALVEKWQESAKVKLVRNEVKTGLAAAVIAAARAAEGEFVVIMDADLSHPPEVIPELLEPLVRDEAEMMIGSRYIRGGDTPEWPFIRKLSSLIATLPARVLTDVKDPLAGFISTRRERLADMDREVCGFKIGLELLATGEEQMRVREVPIIFMDRSYGHSKMSVKVVLDYLKQLLVLAGVSQLPLGARQLGLIFLAVIFIDTALLTMLTEQGIAPGWAQIISFLPPAAIAAFWWMKSEAKAGLPEKEFGPGRSAWLVAGICSVLVLTIFLRSGLVESCSSAGGVLSTGSIFLTGLAGVLSVYTGLVFFVFSIGKKRITSLLVRRYYSLGLAAYLALLRLAFLGAIPALPEENTYLVLLAVPEGSWATATLPATLLAGKLGTYLGPNNLFGLRLGAWFMWAVSMVCLFNLARDIYDRTAAFNSVLLFSVLPFFFLMGIHLTSDAVLTMFWCGAVYLLYRALVEGVRSSWLWAGAVLGFGIQADLALGALLFGVMVYMIGSYGGQNWLSRGEPYLAFGVMLLTLIPGILLLGKPVMSEKYVGPGWLDTVLGPALQYPLLLPFILVTPPGIAAGIYCCGQWLKPGMESGIKEGPERRRKRSFLVSMLFIPLFIFMIPEFISGAAVYWSGLVWAVLIPCMATTLEISVRERGFLYSLRRSWWLTLILLTLIYGVTLHFGAARTM